MPSCYSWYWRISLYIIYLCSHFVLLYESDVLNSVNENGYWVCSVLNRKVVQLLAKCSLSGQWNGSAGETTCLQTSWPEFMLHSHIVERENWFVQIPLFFRPHTQLMNVKKLTISYLLKVLITYLGRRSRETMNSRSACEVALTLIAALRAQWQAEFKASLVWVQDQCSLHREFQVPPKLRSKTHGGGGSKVLAAQEFQATLSYLVFHGIYCNKVINMCLNFVILIKLIF